MGSCPLESLSGLQEGPERRHGLCHTEGMCYLVDQAEPGADICEVLGVGNSVIALMYFSQGLTVVGVMMKPANSTESRANLNLAGLRVMPWLPQMFSHSTACE